MKPILIALFLIVSLLIDWDCTHTIVKSGSDHFEISRVEFVNDYKAYVYVILGGGRVPNTTTHLFQGRIVLV
jgi:hypothetical protein